MKTLGQIAYESSSDGVQSTGPWTKAPDLVRRSYEELAAAVVAEVCRRLEVETEIGGFLVDTQKAEFLKVIEAMEYEAVGARQKAPSIPESQRVNFESRAFALEEYAKKLKRILTPAT